VPELAQQSESADGRPGSLLAGATALGITLDTAQQRQFAALARELAAENLRANLTSITDPDEIDVKHFVDSLTAVPVLRHHMAERAGSIADVGAGAGLPGLALAIALPHHEVSLIEATAKKARFIARAIEVLGLSNARVVAERAEQVARQPAYRERFDVAIARAVGSVATLVELLIRLVRVGGLAMLMKTRARAEMEIEEAAFALRQLRCSVEEVADSAMPGLLHDRVLILVHKNAATPERYPRRAGVPQRRPLVGI